MLALAAALWMSRALPARAQETAPVTGSIEASLQPMQEAERLGYLGLTIDDLRRMFPFERFERNAPTDYFPANPERPGDEVITCSQHLYMSELGALSCETWNDTITLMNFFTTFGSRTEAEDYYHALRGSLHTYFQYNRHPESGDPAIHSRFAHGEKDIWVGRFRTPRYKQGIDVAILWLDDETPVVDIEIFPHNKTDLERVSGSFAESPGHP